MVEQISLLVLLGTEVQYCDPIDPKYQAIAGDPYYSLLCALYAMRSFFFLLIKQALNKNGISYY